MYKVQRPQTSGSFTAKRLHNKAQGCRFFLRLPWEPNPDEIPVSLFPDPPPLCRRVPFSFFPVFLFPLSRFPLIG